MLSKEILEEIKRKASIGVYEFNIKSEEVKQMLDTITAYRAMLDALTVAYDQYVKALTDELGEITGLAYVHGWQSKRGMLGEELRRKIAAIKENATLLGEG